MVNGEMRFAVLSERELDAVMAGHQLDHDLPWDARIIRPKIAGDRFGIAVHRGQDSEEPSRPIVVVCIPEQARRLFGRYAALHSDLSPVSAWCHVLTPTAFDALESPTRYPELGSLEAAWAGLVVAEARLLAEGSLSAIRIPACFATQTFAVARALAIWNQSIDETLVRFDDANRLLRAGAGSSTEGRIRRLRGALQTPWRALSAASGLSAVTAEVRPLARCLRTLHKARLSRVDNEAPIFVEPLGDQIPEALDFVRLADRSPEARLRLFDLLVDALGKERSEQPSLRRHSLGMLAGYLATVAAGGASSLALAEAHAGQAPEIIAWAYLIGGIGERVTWTSSFEGLGRLVVRELLRPLRLDEAPSCDFSLEEALAVTDSALADPLVHLRLKQARVASIALYPGVNVSIPVADQQPPEIRPGGSRGARVPEAEDRSQVPGSTVLPLLAQALWPYLREQVEGVVTEHLGPGQKKQRSGRSGTGHPRLPFKPKG